MSLRWFPIVSDDCCRAIRAALLGGWALGAAGCDLLDRIVDEPPPLPDKHPTQDLTIERGIARFNGTPIAPGVPLSRWVELFGEPDRVAGATHLWDRLGLGAASIDQASNEVPSKLIVDCMVVVYQPAQIFTRGAFTGSTLMEGAAVYAGAKIRHVNRQFRQKCKGTGTGFIESVLQGSYECDTENPRREYELRVYVEDHAAKVRWLNFCDRRE